MTVTFTSRDFNREPGRIKRAAASGPVIITERGTPIIAIMPYRDYQHLHAPRTSILHALALEGADEIDLDFDRPATLPRAAELE